MSLFNPSKDDVREFFCEAWRKQQASGILTPLESIAARWMVEHPEYHDILNRPEEAKHTDFSVEKGQTNPFLHLAMHLSIAEQIQADQPPGIREVGKQLAARLDSEHEAAHQIMECLAAILWESQRSQTPPDMESYVESLRRLI